MKTRDAAATRERILAAATEDFSRHGVAGARVDRISERAEVSKAQIYSYFGDKAGLFDAVFRRHATAVVDAIPFTATDLPAYAAGLYDTALERPGLVRLIAWARLEGIELPLDDDGVHAKLQAIANAQAAGTVVAEISPEDILALVIAAGLTWSVAGFSPVPPATTDAAHDRRRTALRHLIARSFTPTPGRESPAVPS